MTRLPHLPIIVDYSDGAWTVEAQNRMVSALAYPDRVCAIVFRGREEGLKKLLNAMNRPFPALEGLELDFRDNQGWDLLPPFSPGLNYPPPPLRNNPLPLRRLIYTGRADPLLFQILSHTKSLVELTMCVDRIVFSPQRSALLAHCKTCPSYVTSRLKCGFPHFLLPPYEFQMVLGDTQYYSQSLPPCASSAIVFPWMHSYLSRPPRPYKNSTFHSIINRLHSTSLTSPNSSAAQESFSVRLK